VAASAGPLIGSPVGAWGADELRALLGPRLTAQIESYYFDASDGLARLRARVFGAPRSSPWAVSKATPLPAGPAETPVTRQFGERPALMPLPAVPPLFSPPLAGEGQWLADSLPGPTRRGWPAPMAKTFIRPDSQRPYAVVMLVAIDLRQVQLHIVDGTHDPAAGGPGVVPAADQQGDELLAAFNGGFKAADGHYGLMTAGHTYLPPQPGAATLALYADGTVRLGRWGSADVPAANLVAYRENGAPLIENGQVNPSAHTDGYAWGAPILANIYTWRSAVALTGSGVLLYAAGDAVSADTLARALARAGARQAMQLDINPVWVRFETYGRSGASLVAHKLRSDMYGGSNQFLVPYERDFLYVTRYAPPEWSTRLPSSS
jgi:Phosphodiester glycosidase